MLAFGHDLHVAAVVGGVWNDDCLHHFVVFGIAYNASFEFHMEFLQNACIDRVIFSIGMLVVMMCMYDEYCLSASNWLAS